MILINSFINRKAVILFLLILFISMGSKAQNDSVAKKLQWYVSTGLNANFPFKEVIDPSTHPFDRPLLSYYDRNIALGGAISTELKIKIYKSFNIETGLMLIMRSSSYSTDTLRLRELQSNLYPNHYPDITDYYYFPVCIEIPVVFLLSKNNWEFGVGANITAYTFSYRKMTYLNKSIYYDFSNMYDGLNTIYPMIRIAYIVNKNKFSVCGYYRQSRSIDILLNYSFEIYKK